jgi:signal transduction histidine kinase
VVDTDTMMHFLTLFLLLFLQLYASDIILTQKEKAYLQEKKVITMCVDPDWEPFEIINKDGVHEGIAGDLIRLIARRADLDIKLINTDTWQKSLELSKAHQCDILSFLNDTPKRREWLTFTQPLFNDPNVLIGRSDREYIEDISKEHLSIALPHGTAIAERFAKDFPNLTIIPTIRESEAFKLVEERKADITLRSMIIAAYTIKKDGLFNLKIIGEPQGYENHLRIGVRKDEPLLRDILDKAIATLTKENIDKVVNRHVNIVIEKVTKMGVAMWVFIILIVVVLLILLWNYLLKKRVDEEVFKNIQQEKELVAKSRKAEIGEMLANISHQWKNGLTQISSLNLEMRLMSEFEEQLNKEKMTSRLKDTESSIKFMSDTMNVFLDFYKDSESHGEFDIKTNIEEVLNLIDVKIKNSKTTVSIIEKTKLLVDGNKNEWLHIWLNLINNSITAHANNRVTSPLLIAITIDEKKITFQDNAGGFSHEILKKISNNQHHGLGLKMSRDILAKHGYELSMESSLDGTIFTLFETSS